MKFFSLHDLEAGVLTAIEEYSFSCSVLITNESAPGIPPVHGTGVAVTYGGQHYILTAKHVLRGEPDNEKIRVIGRPDGPMQLLRGKQQLADAIVTGRRGQAVSSATPINITGRLVSNDREDIAALIVQNPNAVLPYTKFHDISEQRESTISEFVNVFGFPEEITHHYKQGGRRALPYVTQQAIKAATDIPATSARTPDASIDLVVDFDCPEKCNPRGMSGCGAWSIPHASNEEIWSADKSQLLGIQVAHHEFKLLLFTRIEQVLNLLNPAN